MATERSVSYDLARVANQENLQDVLTGRDDVKRVITRMAIELGDSYTLRAYIDQDRIVDAMGECDVFGQQFIPVNHELQPGETLRVGWYDRAGATTAQGFTVFYTEEPAGVG